MLEFPAYSQVPVNSQPMKCPRSYQCVWEVRSGACTSVIAASYNCSGGCHKSAVHLIWNTTGSANRWAEYVTPFHFLLEGYFPYLYK